MAERKQVHEIAQDMRIFLPKGLKSVIQLGYIIDLIRIYVPNVFVDGLKSLDDESKDSNVVVVDVVFHLNSQLHEKVLNYADDTV